MGDWDKGDYNMKGKEPTICKKFRRIFKNAGYKTFLINEFKTSKLCNCCNEELEMFLERESHKPKLKKENKKELVNGILRCQSVKHKSEIFHNRDKNAVQNMLNLDFLIMHTNLFYLNYFLKDELHLDLMIGESNLFYLNYFLKDVLHSDFLITYSN